MSKEVIYFTSCKCGQRIEFTEEGPADIKCPKCDLRIKGRVSKTESFLSFG